MTAAGLISSGDFPEQFKAHGWYLDDLVLTPVNRLLSIEDIVEDAAIAAGSDAPRYAVPFPGNGQQARFRKEMARLLPSLPSA